MEKNIQDQKLDLMLNFTASLESQMHPTANEKGGITFNPVSNFYICTQDNHPGVTVGYGTFIPLSGGKMTKEGTELLKVLEVQNKQTGKMLSLEEKEKLIPQLYAEGRGRSMTEKGFAQYRSFKNYTVSTQSARAVLRQEMAKKNEKLKKIIGDKHSFIVETVATDLHYQGGLGRGTSHRKKTLRQDQLTESAVSGGNDKMRSKTRKLMALLHQTVQNTSIPDTLSEQEKQTIGDALILKCIALSTQKMEANIKNKDIGISERVATTSKIAAVQIAENVKKRELSPFEFDILTNQVNFLVYENMMQGNPQEILARAQNIIKETNSYTLSNKKTAEGMPTTIQPVLAQMTSNSQEMAPLQQLNRVLASSHLINKLAQSSSGVFSLYTGHMKKPPEKERQ